MRASAVRHWINIESWAVRYCNDSLIHDEMRSTVVPRYKNQDGHTKSPDFTAKWFLRELLRPQHLSEAVPTLVLPMQASVIA